MFRLSLIAALAAAGVASAQPLPWKDAAPAPDLPPDFAAAVMPPVALALPGMGEVRRIADLKYTDVPDPNLLMDVYQPRGTRPGARKPAVIFIHGGTDARAKPKDWGIYQAWGRLAAASGMVGVTFSHRLSYPKTQIREGAADVASAIAYVRREAPRLGVDPDRICLAAYSAGGPMVAPFMTGAPPYVRCLVVFYGFMDIRQTREHQGETPETRDAFSNILHVAGPGRKTPMLLLRAGADDIPTLLDSIDRFTPAALKADYPLTLLNLPGAPHGFDNKAPEPRTLEALRETLAFLKTHLDR